MTGDQFKTIVTSIMKGLSKINYTDNGYLKQLIMKRTANNQVRLHREFEKIIRKFYDHESFRFYDKSLKDDAENLALFQLWRMVTLRNIDPSGNIFSYVTQTAYTSILVAIKERSQMILSEDDKFYVEDRETKHVDFENLISYEMPVDRENYAKVSKSLIRLERTKSNPKEFIISLEVVIDAIGNAYRGNKYYRDSLRLYSEKLRTLKLTKRELQILIDKTIFRVDYIFRRLKIKEENQK